MGRSALITPALEHYADGTVKFKGAYLGGQMHGHWEFFRTDGSMMRSGAFERGGQVGVWRTYDRSGKVLKQTDFDRRSRR